MTTSTPTPTRRKHGRVVAISAAVALALVGAGVTAATWQSDPLISTSEFHSGNLGGPRPLTETVYVDGELHDGVLSSVEVLPGMEVRVERTAEMDVAGTGLAFGLQMAPLAGLSGNAAFIAAAEAEGWLSYGIAEIGAHTVDTYRTWDPTTEDRAVTVPVGEGTSIELATDRITVTTVVELEVPLEDAHLLPMDETLGIEDVVAAFQTVAVPAE